jgi:hypothetical protein
VLDRGKNTRCTGRLLGWASKQNGPRRRGVQLGCRGGLSTKVGLKWKKRGEGKGKGFKFLKFTQTNEFKPRFELNHSKRCTSMYATVNSYISSIN